MAKHSASQMIFMTLNHNITLIGKAWLILMVFLRILVLLFGGFPLYKDEQERFVCNTIQPGCANVCYDMFAPLSLFRFWLVQLATLCLPYVMFGAYVIHKVTSGPAVDSGAAESIKADSVYKIHKESFRKASLCKTVVKAENGRVQYFTGAYILHLLLRMFAEAGFGAAHYYLFGFHIPKRFMCQEAPCTTMVDCYISRPTEKTIMLNYMLGLAALSLLLNMCDLICATKRSIGQKSKRKMLVEKTYTEEQYYLSKNGSQGSHTSILPAQDMLTAGGFQKRGTRESSDDEAASILLDNDPQPASPLGMSIKTSMPASSIHNEDSSSYQATQEEGIAKGSSVVALCPNEPLGTSRSTRVSKRGRLKPPPPPRRDKPAAQGPVDVSGSTAVCARRVGQYTLVEMSSGDDITTGGGAGQEKRSEWV